MPVACVCEVCTKQFNVPPSRLRAGKVRFCSNACAGKGKGGENHANWKGGLTSCTCLECGTGFEVKPKEIKMGRGKYCSRTCAAKVQMRPRSAEHLAKRIIKQCVICSASISVKPSHQEAEGTYCSTACMSAGYRNRMMGPNNPNFKAAGYENYCKTSTQRRKLRQDAKLIETHSGKAWIELVASYGNACACCKRQDVKLTKDHIVPITKGGHDGIGNIQPLCQRCNVKKFTKTIRYAHQLIVAL